MGRRGKTRRTSTSRGGRAVDKPPRLSRASSAPPRTSPSQPFSPRAQRARSRAAAAIAESSAMSVDKLEPPPRPLPSVAVRETKIAWGDTVVTFFDRKESDCVSPTKGPAWGMDITRCCQVASCTGCEKCQLRLKPDTFSPGYLSPSKHNPSPNKRDELRPVAPSLRKKLFRDLGLAMSTASGRRGSESSLLDSSDEEDDTETDEVNPDPYCDCRGVCREETCKCYIAGIGCHIESGEGCGCFTAAHCCTSKRSGVEKRYEYDSDIIEQARKRTLKKVGGRRASRKRRKGKSPAKAAARKQATFCRQMSLPPIQHKSTASLSANSSPSRPVWK